MLGGLAKCAVRIVKADFAKLYEKLQLCRGDYFLDYIKHYTDDIYIDYIIAIVSTLQYLMQSVNFYPNNVIIDGRTS